MDATLVLLQAAANSAPFLSLLIYVIIIYIMYACILNDYRQGIMCTPAVLMLSLQQKKASIFIYISNEEVEREREKFIFTKLSNSS